MNILGLNIRSERQAREERAQLREMLLPIVQSWHRPSMGRDLSFYKLATEGFKQNSAIASVVTAWTMAVQEPPLQVLNKDNEPEPDSELQHLLDNPNPEMDGAELAGHAMFYRLISGNAYIHKVRNGYGQVAELWPYSDAHIEPIPGKYAWVDHYRFNNGEKVEDIDPADMIHLKWFNPDPIKLWKGLGPLQTLFMEVNGDTELSKFIYALLYNDAFPRTALMVPPGPNGEKVPEGVREEMKAKFKERFGGNNRGDVVVLQGTDVKRLSLDLKELQADFLRNGPESRICSVTRTPIEVIGFYAGLANSTYSNKENGMKFWIENTVAALLNKDSRAFTQRLAREFDKTFKIKHDLSNVVALRANRVDADKSTREDYKAGLASLQEARAKLNYGEIDASHTFAQQGKINLVTNGDV
jgi:HK97 family phage portal protein